MDGLSLIRRGEKRKPYRLAQFSKVLREKVT